MDWTVMGHLPDLSSGVTNTTSVRAQTVTLQQRDTWDTRDTWNHMDIKLKRLE